MPEIRVPRVDLPSRRDYENAVAEFWSGGGRTGMIVDALRRNEATLPEARMLAQRLAISVARGYGFMSAASLDEEMENTRATIAVRSGNVVPQPIFDSERCVYAPDVLCPQCTDLYGERWVHGARVEGAHEARQG